MEEKSPNDVQPVEQSTFKDILISANNDDVIIPISSTYDKAVLHIGIGSKSGIIIEKPSGENMTTSVRYATRKFSEYRYKGSNKDRDANDNKGEDYVRPKIEIEEKLINTLQNEKEIARQLLQFNSSMIPFDIIKPTGSLSESEILGQTKSKNDNDDIDQIKTTIVTKSSSDIKVVSQPESSNEKKATGVPHIGKIVDSKVLAKANVNTGIVVDDLTKTIFEALIAKSSVKQACDSIDKAYENEMLAIGIEKEVSVRQPNERRPSNKTISCLTTVEDTYQDEGSVMSKRGSKMFAEYTPSETSEKRNSFCNEFLQSQTSTESDTGTNMKCDVTMSNSKLSPVQKFVIISRESECSLNEMAKKDQVYISEIVTTESEDSSGCSKFDGPDRVYTDSVPSKSGLSETLYSKVTLCEATISHEEIEREEDSDPPDTTLDKRSLDTVSNNDSPDLFMDKRSPDKVSNSDPPRSFDTVSYSDPPDVIVDKRARDKVTYRDPPNIIVDKKSLNTVSYSDPLDAICDNRSLDTISYSDPPDAVVDKRSLDAISYSNPSNTILFVPLMLCVLEILSYSDPYDTIIDTESLDTYTTSHDDSSVAIVENESDGALSDSDTLDEIDDIEPDDAIIDIEERALIGQNEASSVCDVDDIADEENVTDDNGATDYDGVTDDGGETDKDGVSDDNRVTDDDGETDKDGVTVTDDNRVTDDDGVTDKDGVTDDNRVSDDDDKFFGIMNIYTESDLHYDLNNIPAAEHCTENKDFGYKLFSLSTFFIS